MSAYPHLFSPYSIGKLALKNRIVMLPHGTSMVRDGAITDDDIAYYEARAKGGIGMMVTGAAITDPSTATKSRTLVEPYSEHVLASLEKRVAAVHAHGAKIIGQLVHLGREMIGSESDHAPMAPSPLRSPRDPFAPHEMDAADIARIVEAFGHSAANLKRTGHDGIEIHGAHGYLVAQFLSPATNQRSDAYGGTPEKRLRFLREVVEAIRRHCGDDFVLGLRLSADEEIADGLGIQDNVKITSAVAGWNAVDYLSITLGTRGMYVKDVSTPLAPAARAAKLIREASGLPTIVGQRITMPALAEQMLVDGNADLVGMARAFIADADWAAKAERGDAPRIRPCLGLNQDCRSFSPHLHCAVNPMAGRELRPEFGMRGPADTPRRIAVIGAGPGGLEAARVASLRGHAVTVFEASDGIGGQFLYASAVPHRDDLRRLVDYLGAELRRQAVPVELGTRIAQAGDLGAAFDVAIIATGAIAKPVPDEFRGAHVKTWFEILQDGAPAPHGRGRVVLVDDGSAFWWTYGVADALVVAGWKVIIATPSATIASAIPHESVGPLLARLGSGGTQYRVLSMLDGVSASGVSLMNVTSGEVDMVACELVVLQTGREPVTGLRDVMQGAGITTHAIGDCVTPRRMSHAVFEAQRLASSL
jgi:2,4-dienoyl-CoA reductase (NADPH2)